MLFKGFPDAASHFAGNLYQLIRAKLKNDDCLKPFILGLLWLERNCSHNAWESSLKMPYLSYGISVL